MTFSWAYWFNTRPEPYGGWLLYLMLAILVLFIAGSILSRLLANKKQVIYKNLWEKLFNFCLANSIVALLLAFFNYQRVPMLMAKFWYLFWWLEMLVWLIFLALFLKNIPKRKKLLKQQKEFAKYLPK